MTIEEIMNLLPDYYDAQSDAHQFGGEANKSILAEQENQIRLAVEKYAKDKREEMRKECIAACEKERCSEPTTDYGYPYNDAIDDVILAMREIK